MDTLELYKNRYYTDEFIGIYFSSRDKPELVYKSSITDYGNNKECFFGHLNGKQTFNGSFREDDIEILLPINNQTIRYFNEFIHLTKPYEYNYICFMIYVKKNYPNYLRENLSTYNFYKKYKDDSVKIKRIFKDFVYEKNNINKKQLIKFINDFRNKFENENSSSWFNSYNERYTSNKTNKFLDRSGNIYIPYFYEYLKEHTEYEIEDFYKVFKGLLINTAYGVLTVNYEVLLEYSTHVPEIYYILEYITYGKKQEINKDNIVVESI